tara:strand:- start:964 stop:1977 length:1014 start_codon:yes stop_codon:yes gene_type:complete
MPDVEQKTVDVDTSGPGAEVQIPEIDKPENEVTTEEVSNETVIENNIESNDSIEKPDEQSNVQAEEKTEQETEKKVEEENKKEIDDYSDGVKRRIAKLTKKMREAERREQAALEYAKTIKTEQDQLKSKYSKLDTGYVSEMENRIKSSMEAAASKLAKAREDGDLKAEISAQTQISKLGYEEARLAEIKSKQDNKPESVREPVKATEVRQQTVQQPINPDPRAQSWAQKNSWFGSEEAMTYTAFSLHKKLVEEEGFDPQTDEYYSEIDKRIRLEFPHKFDKVQSQTTNKPTQVVASANRSSKPGRKTVRLTSSQVAIAKKLNVPLEEYAKQLKITKE